MNNTDGPRYAETEGLALRDLAKRMRADIVGLQANGTVSSELKVRVAIVDGDTIDVTVFGLRDAATWRPNSHRAPADLLAPARRCYNALVAVHGAYNRQTDHGPRRYNGQVRMLSEADQQRLKVHEERKAAQAQQRAAAREAERSTRWRAEVTTRIPLSIAVVDKTTMTIKRRIAGANVGGSLGQRVRDALIADGWTVLFAHPPARKRGPWWSVTRDDAPPGD